MTMPSETTPGPDHAVTDDAANRAVRTFVQGLAVDVLIALSLLVTETVNSGEQVEWKLLGLLAAKTILGSAASYVHRKLAAPSA